MYERPAEVSNLPGCNHGDRILVVSDAARFGQRGTGLDRAPTRPFPCAFGELILEAQESPSVRKRSKVQMPFLKSSPFTHFPKTGDFLPSTRSGLRRIVLVLLVAKPAHGVARPGRREEREAAIHRKRLSARRGGPRFHVFPRGRVDAGIRNCISFPSGARRLRPARQVQRAPIRRRVGLGRRSLLRGVPPSVPKLLRKGRGRREYKGPKDDGRHRQALDPRHRKEMNHLSCTRWRRDRRCAHVENPKRTGQASLGIQPHADTFTTPKTRQKGCQD